MYNEEDGRMESFVQFAQRIVKAITRISPFPISITDSEGYVIGDTDPARIGTYHLPSQEVLRQNELILYDFDKVRYMENVLPGVAVPLQFDFKTVGVLGIIGDPHEVKPYALLLKNYVEMLWNETYINQLNELQSKTLEMFIHYLLNNNEHDEEKVNYYCKLLNIPTKKERMCIVIDIGESLHMTAEKTTDIHMLKENLTTLCQTIFKGEKDICTFINTERIVLLKTFYNDYEEQAFTHLFKKRSEALIDSVKKYNILKVAIAYGRKKQTIESLHESYFEADHFLRLGQMYDIKPEIFHHYNWDLLVALFHEQTDQLFWEQLNDILKPFIKQPDFEELAYNFIHYCEQQFNISQTAKKLFIHRNTLIYRLNKISTVTNIDLKRFDHCTVLYYFLKRSFVFTNNSK